MKTYDFTLLKSVIAIVMCVGIWLVNQGHGFESLSGTKMIETCGGACEGCLTSTWSCNTIQCYEHEGGYYMKVGTGNTVEICQSGLTGGCDFAGAFVHCHTIKFGCVDDQCLFGCTTTNDYGNSECYPLE